MNFNNKAILGGMKWTTLSSSFVAFSSIIKISILSRFLDKSDFGLMAIALFIISFTNLFVDLGITSAVLHKKKIKSHELSSLYWLNLFISFFLFILISLSSYFIAELYSENSLKVILPIMGINLIILSFGRLFQTLEQKELNFKLISIIEILGSIISLFLGVILAFLNFKVYSLIYSILGTTIFNSFLFLYFGLRKNKIKFYFSIDEIKPFLKIGFYNTGGQIINFINKETDIFLIGLFFGIDTLGLYSLAKQLVYKPMLIINPILTKISIPVFSKMQDDKLKLKYHYLRLINIISSINIPIYIFIFIFSEIFVNILYGDNFYGSIIITKYLCIYMIFIVLRNPMGNLTIASGRTDLEFYWSLFTFSFMPLSIIIGSFISIKAVIIGMTFVMFLLFYPMWYFVINRIIKVRFLEYFKSHIPFYNLIFNSR